jgi:anion-transporting  ArsA/GET3 family ATPase
VDLAQFCAQARLLIVAGKGGVGKTTVSAALARLVARQGRTPLLIEIEGKSGLAAVFGGPALNYETIELVAGSAQANPILARALTPDLALLEYLETHGLRRLSKRLLSSGVLDVVATAVPGLKDLIVLSQIKKIERDTDADVIIVDAPAAGHALTFLMSPRGLADAIRVGPIHSQATQVLELLHDAERCQVVLVTLPEETPVTELIEPAFAVEDRVGVALGPVVVNGCYPGHPSLERALRGGRPRGVSAEDWDVLVRAAEFRGAREASQAQQLTRLDAQLPLPRVQLPLLATADLCLDDLDVLVDAALGAQ